MHGASSPDLSAGQLDQLSASPTAKPSGWSPIAKASGTDPGRSRSSRACTHCSHRKAKCDGHQPCSSCVRGDHDCIYTTPKKRGPPKGAPARGGVRKKLHLENSKPESSSTYPLLQPSQRESNQLEPCSSALGASEGVHPCYSRQYDHLPLQPQPPPPSHPTPALASASHPQSSLYLSAKPSAIDGPTAQRYPSMVDDGLPRTYKAEADLSLVSGPTSRTYRERDTRAWDGGASREYGSRPWTGVSGATASESVPSRRPSSDVAMSSHPTMGWRRSSGYGLPGRTSYSGVARGYEPPSAVSPKIDPSSMPSQDLRCPPPLQPPPPPPPHHQYPHPHRPRSSTVDNNAGLSSFYYPSSFHSHGRNAFAGGSVGSGGGAGTSSGSEVPSAAGLAAFASAPSPTSPHSGWSSAAPRSSYPPRPPLYGQSSSSSLPPPSAPYQYHRSQSTSAAAATSYERSSGSEFLLHDKREVLSASEDRSHDDSPGTSFWASTSELPPPTLSPPPSASMHPQNEHERQKGHRAAFAIRPDQNAEDILPAEVMQRLLDIYQSFVHPHWPIVYLPSIASLQSLQASRPIVFEAILAVAAATFDASIDASDPEGVPSSQLDLFFDSASEPAALRQAWTSGELSKHFVDRVKRRILDGQFERSVATIQAAVLISVVEMGSGNNSSSWHFSGIACRMVLDMNLHRLNGHAAPSLTRSAVGGHRDGSSQADIQEQKRVLWACFILDKILCTVLEKPVQLRTVDIETDVPSVLERDEYDLWLNETTRPFVPASYLHVMEGVKVHAMSSFQSWAQVMSILERILDDVYSPKAKYERRRTHGESDRAVLVRLDEALLRWRKQLPPHLQWSDPPASTQMMTPNDKDRPGTLPHRGVGPHVLTVRGWYCICVILLHRPRVPQLLKPGKGGSTEVRNGIRGALGGSEEAKASNGALGNGTHPHDYSSVPLQPEMQNLISPLSPSFRRAPPSPLSGGRAENGPGSSLQVTSIPRYARRFTAPGLEICSSAAKEVCDILQVYDSTFKIRKIPSSWVYLIFQSATIHSALAPNHAVRAHRRYHEKQRRRQRREEEAAALERGRRERSSAATTSRGSDSPLEGGGGDDIHDDVDHMDGQDNSAGPLLVGSVGFAPEVVSARESERYLDQCLRFLSRIVPTWKSAGHHVATLERLCVASAKTRPSSPTRALPREDEERAPAAAAAGEARPPFGTASNGSTTDGTTRQETQAMTVPATDQVDSIRDDVRGHGEVAVQVHEDPAAGAGGTLYALAHEAVRCRDSQPPTPSLYAAALDGPTTNPGTLAPRASAAAVVAGEGLEDQLASAQAMPPPPLRSSAAAAEATTASTLFQQQQGQTTDWANFWNEMPLSSEDEASWLSFMRSFDHGPSSTSNGLDGITTAGGAWTDAAVQPGGVAVGSAGPSAAATAAAAAAAAAAAGGTQMALLPKGGGIGLASSDPFLTALFGGDLWAAEQVQGSS